MGFQKGFLWGGASAANQYEGGIFEGGRGLANVDVCPAGKDRNPVITGHRKMLEMDKEHTYPGARAVDFYHRFREDIRLFGEMEEALELKLLEVRKWNGITELRYEKRN